jgi:hypothetical protein
MARQICSTEVTLAPNGFSPLSFRWQGCMVRVRSVQSVRTLGTERRYLVGTPLGDFVLGWFSDAGIWVVRRSPSWLDRVRGQWRDAPRYPLPAWRRRAHGSGLRNAGVSVPAATGGGHADRFAVVR